MNFQRRLTVCSLIAGLSGLAYAAGTGGGLGGAGGASGSSGVSSTGNSGSPNGATGTDGNFGGNGTVSNSNTGLNANADYRNAVRLYGANSAQAKAALDHANRATRTSSRSTLKATNGQTYPSNGTFAPSPNASEGASVIFTGVGSGAGMATGTGTGTGSGSTNASPPARP